MGVRYRGHDRQAQSGAAICSVPRRVGAAESFEGMRQEPVREARPVITDLYRQHPPCVAAAAVAGHFLCIADHLHDAAVGRTPDRIIDQVVQRGSASDRRG
jgi:hypothetical protein